MKKIEKINIEKVFLTGQAEEIVDKVNEIIDRLNQSVSQPEEELIEYKDKSNKVIGYSSKATLEKLKNLDATNLTAMVQPEVENNTEEWEVKTRNEMRSKWNLTSKMERGLIDLDEMIWFSINDVKKILSERSFSKEELEIISRVLNYWVTIAIHDDKKNGTVLLEKVNRLLSLDTK